jgi:ribosome-associated protein
VSSDLLRVTARVAIPRAELVVRATRSGGPGGQHVNTAATRVELVWNVRGTTALEPAARARVLGALAHRLDAAGRLRVVASEHRSQRRNREAAEARLVELLRSALTVPRVRRPTAPPRSAVEARLRAKRRRAERKRRRRLADED